MALFRSCRLTDGNHNESLQDITVTSNGRVVAVGSAHDAVGNSDDGPVTIYTTSGRIAAHVTWPGQTPPSRSTPSQLTRSAA